MAENHLQGSRGLMFGVRCLLHRKPYLLAHAFTSFLFCSPSLDLIGALFVYKAEKSGRRLTSEIEKNSLPVFFLSCVLIVLL